MIMGKHYIETIEYGLKEYERTRRWIEQIGDWKNFEWRNAKNRKRRELTKLKNKGFTHYYTLRSKKKIEFKGLIEINN